MIKAGNQGYVVSDDKIKELNDDMLAIRDMEVPDEWLNYKAGYALGIASALETLGLPCDESMKIKREVFNCIVEQKYEESKHENID